MRDLVSVTSYASIILSFNMSSIEVVQNLAILANLCSCGASVRIILMTDND